MAQIYILESAQEPQTRQSAQGTFTTQNIVLRELEGNSKYDQRYAVENLSRSDLRPHVGRPVATTLFSRFFEGEKGSFSNFTCREVIVLTEYEGF